METIDLSQTPSLAGAFLAQMRDVNVQTDPLRFRANLRRMGQIMAYEISRRLRWGTSQVETPLGPAAVPVLQDRVVLATIFRAGLPFHQGMLDYYDRAENAFVSAYRKYKEKENFDVCIEYLASPRLEGKTLILADPMLATGASMELSWRALLTKGTPAHVHVAAVIASRQAVEYIQRVFPRESTTLWVGAVDPSINAHSYIVPGLGDAGDLAFGIKE